MVGAKPKLRLFRFRLRSLFAATLLVAACFAAYQWTLWPQKTLDQFIALLDANEDDETAAGMLQCNKGLTVGSPVGIWIALTSYSKPKERTLGDMILGRQRYDTNVQIEVERDGVAKDLHWAHLRPVGSIDIVRGKIRVHCLQSAAPENTDD